MQIQHGGTISIKVILLLIYLSPFILTSSLQAQTSETVIHQDEFVKDVYHAVTTTKQGETTTTVTVTYEEKMVNGKKVQKKMRTLKEVTDEKYHQTVVIDTMFDQFGAAAAAITEHRYSDGHWIYTEKKQFTLSGEITKAEKYEVGFDGVTKEFPFDKKTGEFSTTGQPISRDQEIDLLEDRMSNGYGNYEKDDTVEEPPKKTSICPAPRTTVFLGYSFLTRDDGVEKEQYNGVDAAFTWYFPNNSDTTGVYYQTPVRQFGIGASVIYIFSNPNDIKLKIAAVTAGPELRYNWNSFSAGIFLHAGVVTDGFKIDDYKDNKTTFTVRPGADLEWYFNEKRNIGIAVRPQLLLTKPNDESKWNFLGSAGITMKLGCK